MLPCMDRCCQATSASPYRVLRRYVWWFIALAPFAELACDLALGTVAAAGGHAKQGQLRSAFQLMHTARAKAVLDQGQANARLPVRPR
jgi:hypothetical protein